MHKIDSTPSGRVVGCVEDQLYAELVQPSRLIRHVALCRLLHGDLYKRLGALALRCLAARVKVRLGLGAVEEFLVILADLAAAEAAESPVAEPLRRTATAALAAHGYRVVVGPRAGV